MNMSYDDIAECINEKVFSNKRKNWEKKIMKPSLMKYYMTMAQILIPAF